MYEYVRIRRCCLPEVLVHSCAGDAAGIIEVDVVEVVGLFCLDEIL